jgi:hypothetical protein
MKSQPCTTSIDENAGIVRLSTVLAHAYRQTLSRAQIQWVLRPFSLKVRLESAEQTLLDRR